MNVQPEALQLADALEPIWMLQSDKLKAAAELRRLREENENLKKAANRGGHVTIAWNEIERLNEVNQMLVESAEMALYVVNEYANSHSYYDESDEVGVRSCCGVVSYKPHHKNCETTKALEALRQALTKAKEQT